MHPRTKFAKLPGLNKNIVSAFLRTNLHDERQSKECTERLQFLAFCNFAITFEVGRKDRG